MGLREYHVVGRHTPTATDANPKIYRMRIFAPNEVVAKSRFWYFVKMQRNVKRANGQILGVNQIVEQKRTVLKNFGIWIRYNSRSGTHNMYKEFRDMTRVGAVKQLYQDMAGRHRARWSTIQIIRVDTVASNKLRRPNLKQFVNSKIRFPLAHRTVRPINRRMAKTFSATRPSTFFA